MAFAEALKTPRLPPNRATTTGQEISPALTTTTLELPLDYWLAPKMPRREDEPRLHTDAFNSPRKLPRAEQETP